METTFVELIRYQPVLIYFAVFGVLFACGLGFPMPEDITLVAAGYAVYLAQEQSLTQPQLLLMIVTCLAGVLSGDLILFGLGRYLGPRVSVVWPFRLLLSRRRLRKVRAFFARYGIWTAFVARFAAGLRAPTYLLAGTARMRFRSFVLADGSAALISVPLLVWLAWKFGAEIDRVKNWLVQSRYALSLVVVAALVWLAIYLWRSRRMRLATRRRQPNRSDSEKINSSGEDG